MKPDEFRRWVQEAHAIVCGVDSPSGYDSVKWFRGLLLEEGLEVSQPALWLWMNKGGIPVAHYLTVTNVLLREEERAREVIRNRITQLETQLRRIGQSTDLEPSGTP